MSKHKSTLKGMQLAFTGPDVPVEMRAAGSSSRYNQARNTIMTIYGYTLLLKIIILTWIKEFYNVIELSDKTFQARKSLKKSL